MQVLVHDDVRIAARIDGAGDDAIILIHGYPLAKEIWNEQFSELAKTHRVVAIDLRGMGKSSVTDGPYLMETLAGDVAAVMDHLQIERATLVGHSLGGYVALAFARMYVERVARLALVCSRIDADYPERAAERRRTAQALEAAQSIVAAEEAISSMVSAKTKREHPQILEKLREIVRFNTPAGLAEMQRGMALRDSAEDIAPDLVFPVLVVAGGGDPSYSANEFEATVRAFPKSTARVLDGSGHFPMIEEAGALTLVLREFVTI